MLWKSFFYYPVHLKNELFKSRINLIYPFNLQLKFCIIWGALAANKGNQFWQSQGNLLEGSWVAQRINEKAEIQPLKQIGIQLALRVQQVCGLCPSRFICRWQRPLWLLSDKRT